MSDAEAREQGDEAEDARWIDRLYGGEDPDGLAFVRGLVARVRDEASAEPPQAISARLLQAAEAGRGAGAPATAPERWWSRLRAWLAPLTSHPGVMAAATVVLVAGAAVLWMRHGHRAAEPTYRAAAERTRDEAPPGPPTAGLAEPAPPVVVQAEEAAPAGNAEGEGRATGAGSGAGSGSAAAQPPAKKAAPKPAPAKTAGRSPIEQPVTTPGPDAPADPSVDKAETTVTGGANQPELGPQAAYPPPANDHGDDAKAAAPADGVPAETPQSLMREAQVAARKGDCARVAALGARVQGMDPSYYRRTFATDPDVKRCRK